MARWPRRNNLLTIIRTSDVFRINQLNSILDLFKSLNYCPIICDGKNVAKSSKNVGKGHEFVKWKNFEKSRNSAFLLVKKRFKLKHCSLAPKRAFLVKTPKPFYIWNEIQSRMSDPSLSDIDFKNKMVWVWTTLKLNHCSLALPYLRHRAIVQCQVFQQLQKHFLDFEHFDHVNRLFRVNWNRLYPAGVDE